MCLIKRTETTYSDGRKDTKDTDTILCAPAANGQPCPHAEVRVTKERSTHSRPSASATRTTPTLIHQRDPPRYFDGSIRIGFNGLRPIYSMRRVPGPTRSLERYDRPSYHDTPAIPPRVPTPPPPHNHDLRLRTATLPPRIHSIPSTTGSTSTTTTTASQSQSYKTIDTQPSTHTPSTSSSSAPKPKAPAPKAQKPRPPPIRTSVTKYAYTPTDIKALGTNTNTIPSSPSSHISTTSHRSYIPGISRLRSNASRHDSAYGSTGLSPSSPLPSPGMPYIIKPGREVSQSRSEGKKSATDVASETSKGKGKEVGKEVKRFNEKFNYTNDFSSDEGDMGKPPSLRGVPRVGERLRGDPEGTARKMRRDEEEARGYQAAGAGGNGNRDEGSVVVEFEGKDGSSGTRRKHRHGSHGSHGHRRHDSGSGSGSGSGSKESKRR